MIRKFSYNLVLLIAVSLVAGSFATFAMDGKGDTKKVDKELAKKAKTMGMFSVKTDGGAYPVFIDGNEVGVSGTSAANEFWVTPGEHTLEVRVPGATPFTKTVNIAANQRDCICLKVNNSRLDYPCPYFIRVDAPSAVLERDLVTFAAIDQVDPRDMQSPTGAKPNLTYIWRVTPDSARITSGLGTPSITVDTTGLGNQIVTAQLEVADDFTNTTACRQRVVQQVKVDAPAPPPGATRVDKFYSTSFDDDKARLDAFATYLQQQPDAQGYIITYQGVEKRALKASVLAGRALNYLVKNRGIDPRRLAVTDGGYDPKTGYEFWGVPPGASIPIPSPTATAPAMVK